MQSQLYAYLINGILEMNAVSNQSLCNTINNQNKLQWCILHYFRAILWGKKCNIKNIYIIGEILEFNN